MSQIKSYNKILNLLKGVISDSGKNFVRRSDVTAFNPQKPIFENASCNNFQQNPLFFKIITKLYMIHDRNNKNDNEPRKIFLKQILDLNSYKIYAVNLDQNTLNSIQSIIFDLTDTKYIMVLSCPSFELLNNILPNNSSASCIWRQEKTIDKTITLQIAFSHKVDDSEKSVHSVSVDSLESFEEVLLKLISSITKEDEIVDNFVFYTFSIVKVNNILLAVLLPRVNCTNKCVINIWPIIPVSYVYNKNNFIKHLKIGARSRRILMTIAGAIEEESEYSVFNLGKEMIRGITFPQIIKNKMTLHQIYFTYFQEFLIEGSHYSFVSVLPESASYVRCAHCQIIYDNIFVFLRHWWDIHEKKIFRCHICNERIKNLTNLGVHYHNHNINWDTYKYEEVYSEKILQSSISRADNCISMKGRDLFPQNSEKTNSSIRTKKRNRKLTTSSEEIKKIKKQFSVATAKMKQNTSIIKASSRAIDLEKTNLFISMKSRFISELGDGFKHGLSLKQ